MRNNYRWKAKGSIRIYGRPLGVSVRAAYSTHLNASEAREMANALLKTAECVDQVPRIIATNTGKKVL